MQKERKKDRRTKRLFRCVSVCLCIGPLLCLVPCPVPCYLEMIKSKRFTNQEGPWPRGNHKMRLFRRHSHCCCFCWCCCFCCCWCCCFCCCCCCWLFFLPFQFLNPTKHLYRRSCPSVCWSVGQSLGCMNTTFHSLFLMTFLKPKHFLQFLLNCFVVDSNWKLSALARLRASKQQEWVEPHQQPLSRHWRRWRVWHDAPLWSRIVKNQDVSTGPLTRPFARSLAPLTHLLAPHNLFHSRAPLRSLARSIAHSLSQVPTL